MSELKTSQDQSSTDVPMNRSGFQFSDSLIHDNLPYLRF
jgi:hypothetical protein